MLRDWITRTFEISHGGHSAIRSMEGLRGLAVFLVFLVHYATLVEPWMEKNTAEYQLAIYLRSIGNAGVDLFFVLSGYLIYGTLMSKERPFFTYMKRRIERIYPTFLVVLAIYLVLSFLYPVESKFPKEADEAFFFLLQNLLLLPGVFNIEPIITVAWSLSYEMLFYLLVPLVIQSLSFRSMALNVRIVLILIASVVLFVLFFYVKDHIRMIMFFCGMLLFETVRGNKISPLPLSGIAALVFAFGFMTIIKLYGFDGWWRFLTLYVCFFILCLDSFKHGSLASKIFSYTPLRWFGNMSYSYYLIHGLTLKIAFFVLVLIYPPTAANTGAFVLFLLPMFVLSLIPALSLFVLVEKPFSLNVKTR